MRAYKCDRCGRLYESYSKDKDYKWHGARLSVIGDDGGYSNIYYDLCPVCAKALVNFMATYENVELCSDGKD